MSTAYEYQSANFHVIIAFTNNEAIDKNICLGINCIWSHRIYSAHAYADIKASDKLENTGMYTVRLPSAIPHGSAQGLARESSGSTCSFANLEPDI
jgi:hypothetical protein